MKTQFPTKINNLIFDIKNSKWLDNENIADIVNNIKFSEKDIKSYFSFDHNINESYGRQLIYDNGNFKILLMSWKSDDFTAIHNHGYTEWGCVYFFGEATHRLYELQNNTLTILRKNNFYRGQVASVCGDLTHIMGNSSSKDFTTLHIYGSNTRQNNVSEDAKVYMPELQKVYTTMGSAYLNMSKDLVLSENKMNNMPDDVLLDYFNLVRPFFERNKNIDLISAMDKVLNQSTHSQHIS